MRDIERGKEVGDRYEVLISDLLPPIYIYDLEWKKCQLGILLDVFYNSEKKRKEKNRFAKEVVWKPQRSCLGSREYFLIQFKNSKSPRMANIIYT